MSMTFAEYPITSVNPSQIAVTDLNNRFRVRQWLDLPEEIRMKQIENDALLLAFANTLPVSKRTYTNPIMSWSIDSRPDLATNLTYALAVGDTYACVDEMIFQPGYKMILPATSQTIKVLDTDSSFSNGWTNAAGNACNLKLDRSFLGGPQVAASVQAVVLPGGGMIGERGTAKAGITTAPGDSVFNFINFYAIYCELTLMQINSLLKGDFGTEQKEMRNIEHQMRMHMQFDMVFGKRAMKNDADEGMCYFAAGLQDQLLDNVLSVGVGGNNLTYPVVNDFIEPMFESRLSALQKDVFAGSALFRDLLATGMQANAIEPMNGRMTYYDPKLGSNTFTFRTASGKQVNVREDKWTFAAAGMSDWGVVLDSQNLAAGEYDGFSFHWVMNTQNNDAITTKKHALMASMALNVIDPSTMGIIRADNRPVVG